MIWQTFRTADGVRGSLRQACGLAGSAREIHAAGLSKGRLRVPLPAAALRVPFGDVVGSGGRGWNCIVGVYLIATSSSVMQVG